MRKAGENIIPVSISLKLTDEDLEDIMCSALEGGAGYWAVLDNTREEYMDAPKEETVVETTMKILLKGGGVTFMDSEDWKTKWVLTLEKLLRGIKMWAEDWDGNRFIDGGNLDIGMIDANEADSILQLALFKDVVFG